MEIKTAIVTGSHVGENREGTQPGRILHGVISHPNDVQQIQTCQAGDEFNPPNGCVSIVGAGGDAYKVQLSLDDAIAPVMQVGGKRIYSVDPTGEREVAEVRLHPDGKVEVLNYNANITMSPNGQVTVANGAASFTMDADGRFTFHGVGSTFDHPVTMQDTLTVQETLTVTKDITSQAKVIGTTDVVFAGKSAKDHTHITTTVGQSTSIPQ